MRCRHHPIPLDKELQEIVRDAQTGRRHVDKLFRVVRRDGVEEWLLIHIERLARDPASRKTAKWQLTRRLYERGYIKEQILNLYQTVPDM